MSLFIGIHWSCVLQPHQKLHWHKWGIEGTSARLGSTATNSHHTIPLWSYLLYISFAAEKLSSVTCYETNSEIKMKLEKQDSSSTGVWTKWVRFFPSSCTLLYPSTASLPTHTTRAKHRIRVSKVWVGHFSKTRNKRHFYAELQITHPSVHWNPLRCFPLWRVWFPWRRVWNAVWAGLNLRTWTHQIQKETQTSGILLLVLKGFVCCQWSHLGKQYYIDCAQNFFLPSFIFSQLFKRLKVPKNVCNRRVQWTSGLQLLISSTGDSPRAQAAI